MIELSQILLSVFIFLLIFSYPINYFNYEKIFIKIKLNFFDTILINISIHLSLLLFFSFFTLNIYFIFLCNFFLSAIFFVFYFKKYINFFLKNYKLFFFFLILCFSLFTSIAYNPLLAWDGVAHWFFKVLNFYQDQAFDNLKNVPFNYYPHLGSFVWSYFWKGSVLQLEYFGRFFYVFLFLCSIFSLFDLLNKNFSTNEKIIFILFFSYFCTDPMLFAGYQEYLIFFLFYFSSRLFFLMQNAIKNLDKNLLSILYLFTTYLLLWSKQEGFFYYIILYVIYIIHSNQRSNFKVIYSIVFFILLSIFVLIKINYLGSLTFNEQWAVRVGSYGAVTAFDQTEFILDFLKNKEPQTRKTSLSALFVLTGKSSYNELMLTDCKHTNEIYKQQKKSKKQEEGWMKIEEIQRVYDELFATVTAMFSKKLLANYQTIVYFILLSCLGAGCSGLPPRRSLDYTEMKIKNYDVHEDKELDSNSFWIISIAHVSYSFLSRRFLLFDKFRVSS
jgi:hypothetical protein